MTTNREVYEGKILETLIKNSERLAVLEQKIDGVDNRLTNVENRLTNVENRLTNVENQLTNVENRLTEIEKLLGWLRIIGGGVVAIALSLIANFIYSLIINTT